MKLLLAKNWSEKIDPTGFWVSEKYDGVRAYWDGHQFLTRDGNKIHAPGTFTENLPLHEHLDGELWLRRGSFEETVSITRRLVPDLEKWKAVTFKVFDAPIHPGTFESRFAAVKRLCANQVEPVNLVRCEGLEHLMFLLSEVESVGGEGLMLRRPGSFYEYKRSGTLLKVKSRHDAEATVIRHLPGEGRHVNRLGALEVSNGQHVFSLGTGFTDAQRENPPPIGSTVTYSYKGFTRNGKPKCTSFLRLNV